MGLLAATMPSLGNVLLAAKIAANTHVNLDGTLIPTDGLRMAGPTKGVHRWWSGKHKKPGGNVQVVTAADGWPLWVSPVRPGREHNTTCARTHPRLLDALDDWARDSAGEPTSDRKALADLGYLGEASRLTDPYPKP